MNTPIFRILFDDLIIYFPEYSASFCLVPTISIDHFRDIYLADYIVDSKNLNNFKETELSNDWW